MTTLRLSAELALPLDAVTQKLAFLGRTGSGKSYAASKLAELMLDAGAQIVVLDPVGIHYGLRLGADGTSAGFDPDTGGTLCGYQYPRALWLPSTEPGARPTCFACAAAMRRRIREMAEERRRRAAATKESA